MVYDLIGSVDQHVLCLQVKTESYFAVGLYVLNKMIIFTRYNDDMIQRTKEGY